MIKVTAAAEGATMIVLLKYFPYAGSNGSSFFTEWVRIPEGNQVWQAAVLSHGKISTTAGTATIQTSWDTSQPTNIGTPFNLATATPTNSPQDITTGMGTLVRMLFAFTADSSRRHHDHPDAQDDLGARTEPHPLTEAEQGESTMHWTTRALVPMQQAAGIATTPEAAWQAALAQVTPDTRTLFREPRVAVAPLQAWHGSSNYVWGEGTLGRAWPPSVDDTPAHEEMLRWIRVFRRVHSLITALSDEVQTGPTRGLTGDEILHLTEKLLFVLRVAHALDDYLFALGYGAGDPMPIDPPRKLTFDEGIDKVLQDFVDCWIERNQLASRLLLVTDTRAEARANEALARGESQEEADAARKREVAAAKEAYGKYRSAVGRE